MKQEVVIDHCHAQFNEEPAGSFQGSGVHPVTSLITQVALL